ncbi:aldose 1-epimerase family protein [Kocuria sp. HSID16901]|uniref:aldose 1-epimerase family protein n=1 Tax=Kocuria sp. HSID16901 TaxID=2419505 RepID=UPI00066075ED|nr:aldose 1-epimerase family protein [Kocuria sp. HSID16901]MCT1368101.1 aldose 1-epimerase family protein [Rothia sp. p3-SID1597]
MPGAYQGALHEISGHGFTAAIAEVGASLVSLEGPSGSLVRTTPPGGPREGCNGAILAPWPNRIRDGNYTFGGRTHQLPLTEPERHNAAHGLALWERWNVVEKSSDAVTLSLDLVPQPGYPFEVRLKARYELAEGGLEWSVEATNEGAEPAPYAVAGHPYLVADGGDCLTPEALDTWSLKIPAEEYLEVDPERLLPMEVRTVHGTEFDLRDGRLMGQQRFDHAFGAIARPGGGSFRCELTTNSGHGVFLECGPAIHWIQVYTDDQPEGVPGRRAVAVEPMTAPADAFRSGCNLTILEPGDSHRAWWRIGPIVGQVHG